MLHHAQLLLTDESGNSRVDTCFVFVNRTSQITAMNPADRSGCRPLWLLRSPGAFHQRPGKRRRACCLGTSPVSMNLVLPSVTGTSATLQSALPDSTVYFWRVIVKNSSNVLVDTSNVCQFRTGKASVSKLISEVTRHWITVAVCNADPCDHIAPPQACTTHPPPRNCASERPSSTDGVADPAGTVRATRARANAAATAARPMRPW